MFISKEINVDIQSSGEVILCKNHQHVCTLIPHIQLNNREIDTSLVSWKCREKEDSMEQWATFPDGVGLSVAIIYSFEQGKLQIDYLARSKNRGLIHVSHSYHGKMCIDVTTHHHSTPSERCLEPWLTNNSESFIATSFFSLDSAA